MSPDESTRELFFTEAKANLSAIESGLIEAERRPGDAGSLDTAFRAAHNLKGMAGMMELAGLASACHDLEDALDAVRRGRLPMSEAADVLLRGVDALAAAVDAAGRGEPEPDLAPLGRELRALAQGRAPAPSPPSGGAPAPPRIEGVEVRQQRLDRLMNLAEELYVTKIRLDALRPRFIIPEAPPLVDLLGRLITELQYQVTQARLVPLGVVFGRFRRMTRDLAKSQGKDVDVELAGGDLELDRRVAEELGEGLVHLLRNAVDHGIETPAARAAAGKPARGTVRVAASKAKDYALVEVEDDGAGLDLDAIRREAEARGLLAPGASREEVLRAATMGLSTRTEATPVSGRGLGLDIVKRKVEGLGGTLAVRSEPGRGTRLSLQVPLSLAIVKGLLVEVAGRLYALPLAGIERIATLGGGDVKRTLGRETMVMHGEDVPLLRLRELFGAPPAGPRRLSVVIAGRRPERIGLVVDALVATQDIVLKPLDPLLRGATRFSGSTISGAGEPVLVLDVPALLQEARQEPVG